MELRRTYRGVCVQRKSQPILDIINRILNISCATAGIERLLVKEQFKTQEFRPQLHGLLQSRPGGLKTTYLEEIGRAYNVTPYSYATYAAMIGSIDRMTGRFIPGLVWETRRKPLLLDEFRTGERGDAGAIDVLLGVLESGHYKRKIAVPSALIQERDDPFFYRVENGEIEVQTRFPCIIATMKNLDMARSEKVRALVQRCIPIRYDLPNEVVDAALQGSTLYHAHKYAPQTDVVINRRDYRKIIELARKIRYCEPGFKEVYTRSVGDLCRIYAVLGYHDMRLYRIVSYLKAGYHIEKAIELAEEKPRASR
jgi:hypothetical protein